MHTFFTVDFKFHSVDANLDTIWFESREVNLYKISKSSQRPDYLTARFDISPNSLGPLTIRIVFKFNDDKGVIYLLKGIATNNKFDLFPLMLRQPHSSIHRPLQTYKIDFANHFQHASIRFDSLHYNTESTSSDIVKQIKTPYILSPQTTINVITLVTPVIDATYISSVEIYTNISDISIPIYIERLPTSHTFYQAQTIILLGKQHFRYRKPIMAPLYLTSTNALKWVKYTGHEIKQSMNCAKFIPVIESNIAIEFTGSIIVGYLQFIYHHKGACAGILTLLFADDQERTSEHSNFFNGGYLDENEMPIEGLIQEIKRKPHNILNLHILIRDKDNNSTCHGIKEIGNKAAIIESYYDIYGNAWVIVEYKIKDREDNIEISFSLLYKNELFILPVVVPLKGDLLCTSELLSSYQLPYVFYDCSKIVSNADYIAKSCSVQLCIHNLLNMQYELSEMPTLDCSNCHIECSSAVYGEYIYQSSSISFLKQNQKNCFTCTISSTANVASAKIVQHLSSNRTIVFYSALSSHAFSLSISDEPILNGLRESNSAIRANSTYPYSISVLKVWVNTLSLSVSPRCYEISAHNTTLISMIEVSYTNTPFYLYYIQQTSFNTLCYKDILTHTQMLMQYRNITGIAYIETQLEESQLNVHATLHLVDLLLPIDTTTKMFEGNEIVSATLLNPHSEPVSGYVYMICENIQTYQQLSELANQNCHCEQLSKCYNHECLSPIAKSSCAGGAIQIINSSLIYLPPNSTTYMSIANILYNSSGVYKSTLIFVNNYSRISVAPLTVTIFVPKIKVMLVKCNKDDSARNSNDPYMLEFSIVNSEVAKGMPYDYTCSYFLVANSSSPFNILGYRIGKYRGSEYGVAINGKMGMVKVGEQFTLDIVLNDSTSLLSGYHSIFVETSLGTIECVLHICVGGYYEE